MFEAKKGFKECVPIRKMQSTYRDCLQQWQKMTFLGEIPSYWNVQWQARMNAFSFEKCAFVFPLYCVLTTEKSEDLKLTIAPS